jgi:hypothetical protein
VVGGWIVVQPYVVPWAQDEYLNWVEGDPYLKVWVNPQAQVYYDPGAQAYGNTIPGFYLSQADARDAGHRSTSRWNDVFDPLVSLNVGLGWPPRSLRTYRDLTPFGESRLSWTEGAGTIDLDTPVRIGPDGRPVIDDLNRPKNGFLTLTLSNRSTWEIHEATVWIGVPSQPRRTYRVRGQAMPKADATFTRVVPEAPPPVPTQLTRDPNGNWVFPDTFAWGFDRIRGIPP